MLIHTEITTAFKVCILSLVVIKGMDLKEAAVSVLFTNTMNDKRRTSCLDRH